MRGAVMLLGGALAACSFRPGALNQDDSGVGTDPDAVVVTGLDDSQPCSWSFTPTNFDPCALPVPPASLAVTATQTLDVDTTALPHTTLAQSDGSPLVVIHLSDLSVAAGVQLSLTGSPFAFAVDGQVTIHGEIVVSTGVDRPEHCAGLVGNPGADSQDENGGAGGGGGGGARFAGGDGGDGRGVGAGTRGLGGHSATSTLSPLRGGCSGGTAGREQGQGTIPPGGRGGGALQISTNVSIVITGGFIDAAGRGGSGGLSKGDGGAGGGSGGGIFLEGPSIALRDGARVCADGGSGGEGGGLTIRGLNGRASGCAGNAPTTLSTPNSFGGAGGDGGYTAASAGVAGHIADGNEGGGGGGGGGAGWIRLRTSDFNTSGLVFVTPMTL